MNIHHYNPPINFTHRHVLDSYHAVTPVWVDICPPPLISIKKKQSLQEKARTSVSIFILLYMEQKLSDGDIRKLVGMLFQKLQRRQ